MALAENENLATVTKTSKDRKKALLDAVAAQERPSIQPDRLLLEEGGEDVDVLEHIVNIGKQLAGIREDVRRSEDHLTKRIEDSRKIAEGQIETVKIALEGQIKDVNNNVGEVKKSMESEMAKSSRSVNIKSIITIVISALGLIGAVTLGILNYLKP